MEMRWNKIMVKKNKKIQIYSRKRKSQLKTIPTGNS